MNEATKEQLAEEKNSEGKRSKLQQEIIEQKKLIETSVKKHRDSELALRKVSFHKHAFVWEGLCKSDSVKQRGEYLICT